MPLCNAILEPMVSHVEGFRFAHADLCMEDAMGGCIVSFKWCTCGGLGMAHFLKSSNHGYCFLRIEEEGTSFGLGGRCSDSAKGFTEHVNRTVGFGSWGVLVAP